MCMHWAQFQKLLNDLKAQIVKFENQSNKIKIFTKKNEEMKRHIKNTITTSKN